MGGQGAAVLSTVFSHGPGLKQEGRCVCESNPCCIMRPHFKKRRKQRKYWYFGMGKEIEKNLINKALSVLQLSIVVCL